MQLKQILKTALERGASDVYLTTGSKPTFRIDGNLAALESHAVLSEETAKEYLFELMTPPQKTEFEAKMDVDFSYEIPDLARFRVNVFIQRKGIGGVLRLIPTKIPTIEELKLPPAFQKIPKMPNGLVLVTGPTGSGKSTTLAALINDINRTTDAHIITIEDPIEFVYENEKSVIDQREVRTNTESFQSALRAALREDPDVILVGEMRDPETIGLAITAAETGHLVFATLHTSGAAKSIERIVNVFPGERQNQVRSELAEALRAVIWQKLLRKKGGKGRIGAYEIFFINNAAATLIRESKTHQISTIIETGGKDGMQTMKKSIESLLAADLITDEEAAENIGKEKS